MSNSLQLNLIYHSVRCTDSNTESIKHTFRTMKQQPKSCMRFLWISFVNEIPIHQYCSHSHKIIMKKVRSKRNEANKMHSIVRSSLRSAYCFSQENILILIKQKLWPEAISLFIYLSFFSQMQWQNGTEYKVDSKHWMWWNLISMENTNFNWNKHKMQKCVNKIVWLCHGALMLNKKRYQLISYGCFHLPSSE